jgi:hypothetical protein
MIGPAILIPRNKKERDKQRERKRERIIHAKKTWVKSLAYKAIKKE